MKNLLFREVFQRGVKFQFREIHYPNTHTHTHTQPIPANTQNSNGMIIRIITYQQRHPS